MAVSLAIRELLEGQSVASSRLSAPWVNEMMGEGLLVPVIRGSRKSYRARDVEALRRCLVDRDERYRLLEVNSEAVAPSRATMAAATGNSKLVMVRSCPGFPVNAYEPIVGQLNGQVFVVNPAEGSFQFVTDWERFEVPSEVIIVGVENMENFRMIRRQRSLFEREIGCHRLLFVSRYPQSSDLRRWLQSTTNRYVHFGDFDLAGIHIFLTEFRQHLGPRASFLIPSDIEPRLRVGSTERYDAQYPRFCHLASEIPEIQRLIDLINKYRRGYDQEGYIELSY